MKEFMLRRERNRLEGLVNLALGLAALLAVGNLVVGIVKVSSRSERIAQALFHPPADGPQWAGAPIVSLATNRGQAAYSLKSSLTNGPTLPNPNPAVLN